jgi:uncharacterized surface protein with fasciclin (FAS1) repeats
VTKKKIITIIFLVTLLAIAGASLWYIVNGGKTTTNQDEDVVDTRPTTSSSKDIMTFMESETRLTNFRKLLNAAGLSETLKLTSTSYLVMAPTNEAFKMLPAGYFDSLLTNEKQANAQDIAKYHIAPMPSIELGDKQKLKTLEGQEVIVSVIGGKYYFTSAKGDKALAIKTAQKTANGTLYVIDKVLLPQ